MRKNWAITLNFFSFQFSGEHGRRRRDRRGSSCSASGHFFSGWNDITKESSLQQRRHHQLLHHVLQSRRRNRNGQVYEPILKRVYLQFFARSANNLVHLKANQSSHQSRCCRNGRDNSACDSTRSMSIFRRDGIIQGTQVGARGHKEHVLHQQNMERVQ